MPVLDVLNNNNVRLELEQGVNHVGFQLRCIIRTNQIQLLGDNVKRKKMKLEKKKIDIILFEYHGSSELKFSDILLGTSQNESFINDVLSL